MSAYMPACCALLPYRIKAVETCEERDDSDWTSNSGSFEGPEKVLEVWFSPKAEEAGGTNRDKEEEKKELAGRNKGLRAVERDVWENMLSLVKCQVLSTVGNDYLDAYLLSESSYVIFA
mmetsp:Transcript_36609/g.59339  ORF Transcript_36609/g.59339 Transcript_36609/m.59339 type:complete len:119 (-) Transcript_36609:41-397(-)